MIIWLSKSKALRGGMDRQKRQRCGEETSYGAQTCAHSSRSRTTQTQILLTCTQRAWGASRKQRCSPPESVHMIENHPDDIVRIASPESHASCGSGEHAFHLRNVPTVQNDQILVLKTASKTASADRSRTNTTLTFLVPGNFVTETPVNVFLKGVAYSVFSHAAMFGLSKIRPQRPRRWQRSTRCIAQTHLQATM